MAVVWARRALDLMNRPLQGRNGGGRLSGGVAPGCRPKSLLTLKGSHGGGVGTQDAGFDESTLAGSERRWSPLRGRCPRLLSCALTGLEQPQLRKAKVGSADLIGRSADREREAKAADLE
jgi:hypothetical protein